jgi:hypothetical protein
VPSEIGLARPGRQSRSLIELPALLFFQFGQSSLVRAQLEQQVCDCSQREPQDTGADTNSSLRTRRQA